MIKLSRLTDYGFLVLLALGKKRGQDASASGLSEETSIPEPTCAKILKILNRADLLDSQRGAKGGYRLKKDLHDISIGEVIEAFEGRIALTACIDHGGENCALESVCEMNGKWSPLNKQIRELFYNHKISDMVQTPYNSQFPNQERRA